ncbi:hypothetical protein C5P11_08425 [Escherichia coli]|nr:hypothetical protein C5P11_08425 [Escherichia coli]
MPENPASYRVVRTKSYLFNKARKTLKKQRSAEEKPTGVVEWAVEVFNQHQTPVALYSILTLVARQHGDFVD